jgi:hypothetical protein
MSHGVFPGADRAVAVAGPNFGTYSTRAAPTGVVAPALSTRPGRIARRVSGAMGAQPSPSNRGATP